MRSRVNIPLSAANRRKHEDWIRDWLNASMAMGATYSGSDNEVSSHIRRYLFELNESKCCKCGWSSVNPVTGNVPLQVNHLDGDSTNNAPDNVELICPNCHSLTPNFGALNMGNGKRRKKPS